MVKFVCVGGTPKETILMSFSDNQFCFNFPSNKKKKSLRKVVSNSEINSLFSDPVVRTNKKKIDFFRLRSICIYHQYAVGRAPTREYLFSTHKCDPPLCRNGCHENESINHVVFVCKFNSKQRAVLIKKCNDLKIKFTLKNLLINKRLQILVEKFLLNAHNDN